MSPRHSSHRSPPTYAHTLLHALACACDRVGNFRQPFQPSLHNAPLHRAEPPVYVLVPSRLPSQHVSLRGVRVWARADNQMALGAGEDTVQRRLAAAGYSTVLAGKWHLGLEAADADAVHASRYDQLVSAVRATGFTTVAAAYENNIDRESLDGGLAYSHNLDWCTASANAAIVEAVAGGSGPIATATPFFLFFTPTVPHTPSCYEALSLYNSSSTPAGLLDTPPDPGFAMSRVEIVQHADDWAAAMSAAVDAEYSAADIERTQNAVAGLIWLDQALGSMLSTLEATAALENTVVVLTIDHGHGEKASLSTGEGIRVALMVRYPALFEAGTIVAGYTTNLDHAPSFLALAGIVGDGAEDSAMSTDGASWAGDSFVENGNGVGGDGSVLQMQPRCLFFEVRLDRAVACSSAVAGGVAGMKLVLRSPQPGAAEGYCAVNPLSLHNVSADPAERNELSRKLGSGPQTALAALQSRLDCHAASTGLENELAVDLEGNASGANMHSGLWTECGDANPPASDHGDGDDLVADVAVVDSRAGGVLTTLSKAHRTHRRWSGRAQAWSASSCTPEPSQRPAATPTCTARCQTSPRPPNALPNASVSISRATAVSATAPHWQQQRCRRAGRLLSRPVPAAAMAGSARSTSAV